MDGASLRVDPQTILSVLGERGCGESTLGKTINGCIAHER